MDSSELSTRELHLIRSKMWDASVGNHRRYLDEETGLFAGKYVESRSCPVCGGAEHRLLFQKSGGLYVKCAGCAMVFLNPILRPEALKDYYAQNHAVQSEIVELDSQFYRTIYHQGLDLLRRNGAAGGRIVDVGCSAGSFLDIAKSLGWETHGLELNRTELEHCRKKGHQVQSATLESARFEQNVDVITLWDVFEHIPDGVSFLRQAAGVLAPEGLLFVQSPQSSSLAARVLQQKCNMFDGLEHVNLYDRDTLEKAAGAAGYQLVAFDNVIAELGVLDNYLHYDDPYLGPTKNKETFLGLLSAEQVLKAGLGYKFQAILKKAS